MVPSVTRKSRTLESEPRLAEVEARAEPRRHLLTVNVEDYYHVRAFNKYIQRNRWQRFESRIELTTQRALDLLAKHDAQATFFVLGWIAEQFPHVIRRVAEAGHEVGVRGFYHRGVHEMTPDEFQSDALRARDAVEAATGRKVYGYRLADGWLQPDDLWALDALAELGFVYDSSIAPIRHSFADEPGRLTPHEHRNGNHSLLELPISCGKILGVRVPVAGGNYLRQLPKFLTGRAAAKWDRDYPTPMVAYFHTWELDPEQPRLAAGGRLNRMRHYRNLAQMPERLGALLTTYRFGSCADYLQLAPEPAPPAEKFVPLTHTGSTPSGRMERANFVPAGDRKAISIVVPCFNEELIVAHLRNTLDEVRERLGYTYDVTCLLVEDGSTDQTWAALKRAFGNREGYQLLRHDVNLGIAAAIMTGIRGANTEIVCSMDSDCSYDPLKLAELIPLLTTGVDLVTASPYHPAGGVKNVPAWRLKLSKGCAWLYRRVLRTNLHTYTSCLRVYRRSTIAAIPLVNARYLGIAELVGRLDLAGKTVVEHPAVLECRLHGRSKMKTVRTILGHLRLMLRLMFDRRRQQKLTDRDAIIRGQVTMISKAHTVVTQDTPAPKRLERFAGTPTTVGSPP